MVLLASWAGCQEHQPPRDPAPVVGPPYRSPSGWTGDPEPGPGDRAASVRRVQITATDRAAEVVTEMTRRRAGALSITIGTGCCESTAPFLYEDFWSGPDQEQVGSVAGVPVFAPEYLRSNYPGSDGVVLDVVEELGESLSVETELGVRLILRGADFDSSTEPQACAPTATTTEPVLRPVVGQLPEALRNLRMR